MRKLLFVLSLLAAPSWAQDCEVSKLKIKPVILAPNSGPTGRMMFRAIPVHRDGTAVNVDACQLPGISWGLTHNFAGLSVDGYKLWIDGLEPGDVVTVEAHLSLDQDVFSAYRETTFLRAFQR